MRHQEPELPLHPETSSVISVGRLGFGWVQVLATWVRVPSRVLARFESQPRGFKSQSEMNSHILVCVVLLYLIFLTIFCLSPTHLSHFILFDLPVLPRYPSFHVSFLRPKFSNNPCPSLALLLLLFSRVRLFATPWTAAC